jgi:PAB1-binding protein PBP1
MIDASIRGRDLSYLEGRNLVSVSNSWLDPGMNTSLESDGKIGEWNQFETNMRLFNVKSTYDENLYTKKLDMSLISKEALAEADRLAHEIEGTASTNIHVQEERGEVYTYNTCIM